MDAWYEALVEIGEGFGLDHSLIDMFKDEYDRRLEPLDALIVRMHDAGLCSKTGDFGPEWQGVDATGADATLEDDDLALGDDEEP